jgi:hypothetical protein
MTFNHSHVDHAVLRVVEVLFCVATAAVVLLLITSHGL